MTSLTPHRYSISLLTGVSQFVLRQFVPVHAPPRDSLLIHITTRSLPTGVLMFTLAVHAPPRDSLPLYTSKRSLPTGVLLFIPTVLPAMVPAALPIQAVVRIAVQSVSQEKGPR